jgi:hypothetical protein
VTADRDVNVRIVQDQDAYLGLESRSNLVSEDSPPTGDGTITIDLTKLNDYASGSGFNKAATTEIVDPEAFGGDALLAVRNQSDRVVEVSAGTVGAPSNLEQAKPRDPSDDFDFVDDGIRIEFFDVLDSERVAIDDDHPRTLGVGDALGLGLRVIVPESASLGEHTILVLFRALEVTT